MLLLSHLFAPLRCIDDNNGIGPNQIWAIDDRAAKADGWRWPSIEFLCDTPRMGIRWARHIANADDSVGKKKRVAPGSTSI